MALRDTSPPESAGPRPRTAPALDPADRGRLLSGAHHNPHALLGAHPVPGGIVFRALRPFADAVSVVIDGDPTPLVSEGDGLFSVVLPLDAVPAYTLLVSYEGAEHKVDDPYRFLPRSATWICISSGRGGTRSCGRRSAPSRWPTRV